MERLVEPLAPRTEEAEGPAPRQEASQPWASADSDTLNPVQQAIIEVVRRRRALVGLPLLCAALGAGFALILPKQYEGVTIFTPSQQITPSLPSNLQAIASQFGINAQSNGYSVYFFAQVLGSREALKHVVSDTLSINGRRLAVLDLLDASGDSPEDRLEDGIKSLPDYVTIRTDDQSNLVTLRVLAPSPETAEAMVQSFLRAVNIITMSSLNAGGSFEWRFAQGQADSAQDVLRKAEDALRDFYRANRNFASSPALQTEEARLQRDIQIRRDVYLTLVQQAEAAKLQAVRNTPAITIVQPPQASVEKASPKASLWALMAAIGGFTVVVGWIYYLYPILPQPLRTRLGSPKSKVARFLAPRS